MELSSLGRYEIRGELGRGTMGVVYRGFDPVLERELALKTVRLSHVMNPAQREKYLARFFREAKIAAKLLHPNIVVTHDADTAAGVPFIVMELVSGGSLGERVAAGAVSWQEAAKLTTPIAAALDYAHAAGIVHRDVKPANVLMTATGVPKLADFGIARLPSSELTEAGAMMGTPYYMSPEQVEADEVDGRSDLYSLGVLFYALVAGRAPFIGQDIASITQQVLYKDPIPLSELVSDLPPSLDGVLARALAKKPGERYQSGADFAEDLARIERGETPELAIPVGERTAESKPQSVAGPVSASDHGSGGVGVAILALGVVAVLAFLGREAVPRGFSEMIESRRETSRRDTISSRARVGLETARDLTERGHWQRALSEVEEALRLYREASDGAGEAEALLLRGDLFAEQGEWSKARTDLDAAGAVFTIYDSASGAVTARVELAHLERDLGAYDNAEALYQQAIAEGAGSEATLGLSLLHMLRGQTDLAREGLESIPSGDAVRARAELYLGALASADGNVESAARHWDLAAGGVDSAEVDLWRGYALLLHGGDARSLFEKAAESFRARDHRPGLLSARDGLEGRVLPSDLGSLFLGQPRTRRSEALASRF